jgi:hypothetical protein
MTVKAQGLKDVFNTTLTANDATAQERVGALRIENDDTNGSKVYMYVLAGGAIANGTTCQWENAAGTAVKANALTEGLCSPIAGVGIGTITDEYYGWIQVKGYHGAIISAATQATTEFQATVAASGGHKTIGSCTVKNPSGVTALETITVATTTFKGQINVL